jgi:hypothetical protein
MTGTLLRHQSWVILCRYTNMSAQALSEKLNAAE